MGRDIGWTEDAELHIGRHGVVPADVEDVVFSRPRWVAAGRDGTRLVFGRTLDGRYLLVVLAEAADGTDFCVTARHMTTSERRLFRRKTQWGG